jgi:hypothetical protein
MKRIHWIGLSLGVVITALAWWVSGAPILERGAWAVGCYVSVFVAAFLGASMSDIILADREEAQNMANEPKVPAFDYLQAEIDKLNSSMRVANERIADVEKRLSSLSIVTGLRPANRVIQELKK